MACARPGAFGAATAPAGLAAPAEHTQQASTATMNVPGLSSHRRRTRVLLIRPDSFRASSHLGMRNCYLAVSRESRHSPR